MVQANISSELEIPVPPSHLRTKSGSQIAIADLSEEQLTAVGDAWTKALLAKAAPKLSTAPATPAK